MRIKSRLFILAALLMTCFLAAGLTRGDIQQVKTFPEDIAKILKNSCFDCHTTNARGEDAKAALNFDIWMDYNIIKKIGQLTKINEVLGEGIMPPEKYLGNKPDRALSGDQIKLVREWTRKETEKLMK